MRRRHQKKIMRRNRKSRKRAHKYTMRCKDNTSAVHVGERSKAGSHNTHEDVVHVGERSKAGSHSTHDDVV